jgi:hypothetical protein
MPPKRKISRSKRGRKGTISKKRKAAKETIKRELPKIFIKSEEISVPAQGKKGETVVKSELPGRSIKSEKPSVPTQAPNEESKREPSVDKNRVVYQDPQPTVPEGHKIIHVLRHFRAWHKYYLLSSELMY